jgi:hypothetical protein
MWTCEVVVGCNFVAHSYIAMGGISECIMLMNDEPHVILGLLVGLKKNLMTQKLIMLE